MLHEILIFIGIAIVYKKIQHEPIGRVTRYKQLPLSTSRLLAFRNKYPTCKVIETIRELCETIEHLVWLRNTPNIEDTTFDSPFIFEDQANFMIPISPDGGSPALDHVELYNTTVTHLKILCFQLQVMGANRDHAKLVSQSVGYEHIKILLNTKETRESSRELMKVVGRYGNRVLSKS